MKNIKYVVVGILVLGALGAIFKPKKESENDIKPKKVNIETKKNKLIKKPIDLDNSDFWNLYDPMVKERIYKLIEKKDCEGLQNEFNISDDNGKSQIARTGHNNSELMSFIDEEMRKIDCYN